MQERHSIRRKNRRVTEPLPILVFWTGVSGRFEADICDISLGGCFLNTNGDAADGESITLEIPISPVGDEVVEVAGVVIPQGRRFKGFGVRFAALNEDQRSLIERLVAQAPEQEDHRI